MILGELGVGGSLSKLDDLIGRQPQLPDGSRMCAPPSRPDCARARPRALSLAPSSPRRQNTCAVVAPTCVIVCCLSACVRACACALSIRSRPRARPDSPLLPVRSPQGVRLSR